MVPACFSLPKFCNRTFWPQVYQRHIKFISVDRKIVLKFENVQDYGMQFIAVQCYFHVHYNDVIMGAVASQITSLTIVYSAVDSDANQRKHQSSASLAFVRGIHRGPVNSSHKWPVTRKMFPFDDVIMDDHGQLDRHGGHFVSASVF